MEIIQVLYRGRGGEHDTGDKELIFYLSDHAVYYADEERILALRERTLSLLNILLILKTSIMTRIQGYGQIGLHRFMMIPNRREISADRGRNTGWYHGTIDSRTPKRVLS